MYSALFFFFSSRRRHTRLVSDWSSDVCSSDLEKACPGLDPGWNPVFGKDHAQPKSERVYICPRLRMAPRCSLMRKVMRMNSEIGRASCRERVWMSVVAVWL